MAVDTFGIVGSTIKTFTGRYFDLANPTPDQVDVRDIASALSKICRFGGHCPVFYSVAEHSINCLHRAIDLELPVEVQAACLMHDAAEAYVGDVVKPLKNMIDGVYSEIEERVEAAIAEAFKIDFAGTRDQWKKIDREMLISERFALFGADGVKWAGEEQIEMVKITPRCSDPVFVEKIFIFEWNRLEKQR